MLRRPPKEVEEIRRMAHAIYLENRDHGLEDDPERDWAKAEAIFCNKPMYMFWIVWHWIKREHYPLISVTAITALFANAGMMTWSIMTNAGSTDLNTRPYVSVNIQEPLEIFQRGEDVFYGNNFVLKNTGRIPAAKVSTSYYITTDLDKDNMHGERWFVERLGGFGGTAFITPQATELEPGFRSLSPASANYYYWEALTSYEGLQTGKKYWTHVRKIYFVNRPANQFIPVLTYGEWDRNERFVPPRLSTKEEVVAFLEEIRQRAHPVQNAQ